MDWRMQGRMQSFPITAWVRRLKKKNVDNIEININNSSRSIALKLLSCVCWDFIIMIIAIVVWRKFIQFCYCHVKFSSKHTRKLKGMTKISFFPIVNTYKSGSNESIDKLSYVCCGLSAVPILFCSHAQKMKKSTGRKISTIVWYRWCFCNKKFFQSSKRILANAFVCLGWDAVSGVIGLIIIGFPQSPKRTLHTYTRMH